MESAEKFLAFGSETGETLLGGKNFIPSQETLGMGKPRDLDSSGWAFTAFQGYNYFGQRYSVAPDRVALVGLLADAVYQVATSLAVALQVPRQSRWRLTLMRWLTPRRYERTLRREQKIWAEAIAFVTWKLRESLFDILFDWAWGVSEHVALEAGLRLMAARRSPKSERQRFIRPLNRAMSFYEEIPTLEEALERLSRMGRGGSDQRADPEVLQELQREVIHTLEPWAFVYRWERLPPGRTYPESVLNSAQSSSKRQRQPLF
jgi:hypothetical protein